MPKFPHNFFWGAATSAYQVEGNNLNCDWWEWEERAGLKERSGEACRHYDLYKEDFDLARALNHNAHRLSIEWSRIEPEENKFSESEIGHYRDVILALRERNIEPIVTLHHFTNPLWFAKLGGWQNKKSAAYFSRYVEKIVEALSDKVCFWVTINEPMVYVYHAYILGIWPPQEKSFYKARRVTNNFVSSHIKAYKLIHSIYRKRNLPAPKVSIAKNTQAFVACGPTFKNRLAVYLRDKYYNFNFIERLIRHRSLDFIGINYYSRNLVGKGNHIPLEKNSLGWDIYPEGLYYLLLKFGRYNLPIFILENGICSQDDNMRWRYISQHLNSIHRAMEEGVKVMGYIYWSLIDNYEWDKGFGPRFGLIEVDYDTYQRTVRESGWKFSSVCKTGRLD